MNGAGRRRREICDSPLVRTHARSRADIESPRARVLYTAEHEHFPATALRAGARVKFRPRHPTAYGQGPSPIGLTRPQASQEVVALHRLPDHRESHPTVSLPYDANATAVPPTIRPGYRARNALSIGSTRSRDSGYGTMPH